MHSLEIILIPTGLPIVLSVVDRFYNSSGNIIVHLFNISEAELFLMRQCDKYFVFASQYQDPMASELQLQPASVAECDQLQRLAQLYSLHLRVADEAAQPHARQLHTHPNSCFVTKTR